MMRCAVSNHLLVDGVLVEDEAIRGFIRKRVVDFRTSEKICKKCKEDITGIYRDKMKRAIAKHKLKTISSSSEHSTVANNSSTPHDSYNRLVYKTQSLVISPSNTLDTPPVIDASYVNLTGPSYRYSVLQENVQPMTNSIRYQPTKTPQKAKNADSRNSRVDKLLNIYYSRLSAIQESSKEENASILWKKPRLSQQPTTSKAATTSSGVSTLSNKVTTRKRTVPTTSEAATTSSGVSTLSNKVTTRKRTVPDSEQPTTSKAASKKRLITDTIIIDSVDEDEPRYSLNAFDGTRLPNIQPMPPKKRPRTDLTPTQLAMLEYARNVTGG